MPLNQPLTDKEFDELDQFLLSEQTPEDAMAMDILHGYLTAIAIGPESIPEAEWMSHIWGSEKGQEFRFKSEKERQKITQLIRRFMNEITVTFEVSPKEYEPLYCESEWEGQVILDAEPWALGFWEGVCLRKKAWEAIWENETADLLHPIYLLGSEELREEEDLLSNDPSARHQLALDIEENIPEIYAFWEARHRPKLN